MARLSDDEIGKRLKGQKDADALLSKLLPWNDVLDLDVSIDYILKGFIPRGAIVLFFGRGGVGKSSIMLHIAHAVAGGVPYLELDTARSPVYYVDFENPLAVLKDRVGRIGKTDNLWIWHASNEAPPPRLDSKEWEAYKKLPPGLLVFDTLRAAHLSDENDSRHMAIIITRLKQIRDLGFTIVLLHHTPKGNDSIYKGSTALLDLADHVVALEQMRDDDSREFSVSDPYRLHVTMKTRYEPCEMFLMFDAEKKGFTKSERPGGDIEDQLHDIMVTEYDAMSQTELVGRAMDELKISRDKIYKALRSGEGRLWKVERGAKNGKRYVAL